MALEFVLLNEEDGSLEAFSKLMPKDYAKNHPDTVFVGALLNEQYPCGVMGYSLVDFEIVIDYLYTFTKARRNKIATQLINSLLDRSKTTGNLFPVSVYYDALDDNSGIPQFFESYDRFDISPSHTIYSVEVKDLEKCGDLFTGKKVEAQPFFDLPTRVQKQIIYDFAKESMYYITDYADWEKHCVKDLCLVTRNKEELTSLVFVMQDSAEQLCISYAYSKGSPVNLMGLLGVVADVIRKNYPNASIEIETISDSSEKLLKKLFPKSITPKESISEAIWNFM